MGTDCGQLNNPLPPDCIVLAARALRMRGVTERQLDMMLKENPARLLGLSPPAASRPTASGLGARNGALVQIDGSVTYVETRFPVQ